MSYTRDRDRQSRGVGAIAARDLSPKARRRFAARARRSMGDMPSGDCWQQDNAGAFYIRRANGNIERVTQAYAMQFPSCVPGATPQPAPGGYVGPRSAQTGLQRSKTLISSMTNAQSLYTSGPMTDTQPVTSPVVVVAPTSSGTTPVSPSTPVISPTPVTPTKPKATVTTKPTLVKGGGATTTWVPPSGSTVMTFPAPSPVPEDPGAPPAASASSSGLLATISNLSTGKKVGLGLAGIGLLYLLTRK